MRAILLTLPLWLVAGPAAPAADWAQAMFSQTSHDFGVVARGAQIEHRFPLENIYLEDVRIKSVRSTCGCTVAEPTKTLLKTHQKAEIVATLDTRRFSGRKDATLTVTFDQPFPAEVQLHVYAYIRSDVVLEPGAAEFGSVLQGTGARLKVALSYAGSNDWRITGIERANPALDVRVQETGRYLGQVSYDIWIELRPDAPLGYLRDLVRLKTNDRNPQASQVVLPVQAAVVPAVSVRPSMLSLGILHPGDTVVRNLVVHADSPIRILNVSVPDKRFSMPLPPGARTLHLIPVTFVADQATGRVSGKITIQTDRPGSERLEVPVGGQIVAGAGETPKTK